MVTWLLDRFGLARVAEVDDLHHRLVATEFERDEARIRLAQCERAFAHQSMAFSRRYEALENNVLQGVHMRMPAPIIFPSPHLPNTADDPPPFGHTWERPDPRSGTGPVHLPHISDGPQLVDCLEGDKPGSR